MNDPDAQAFKSLFRDAYEKCFGHSLMEPLTETESKLFYNRIFDKTGMVVGWKSLKNYSSFIVDAPQGKTENPSVATLDSLARYVMDAPLSSETERKDKENYFPYWFEYKEGFHRSLKQRKVPKVKSRLPGMIILVGVFLIIIISSLLIFRKYYSSSLFIDNFHDLSQISLADRGWFVQSPDTLFWKRRDEKLNQLTLFTLRGDNWPSGSEKIGIHNLLLRKITKDCFETEVHFSDFLPNQNWQQAGILLLEDTNFTGKGIRMSIAYNDISGGSAKPKEIIIQVITTSGKNDAEPEEIAHQPILFIDSIRTNPALMQNLQNNSLKIVKEGKKFRFLFAGGPIANPAFKEVITHEFNMQPKFIGLFAIKGFLNNTDVVPVHFNLFRLKEMECE